MIRLAVFDIAGTTVKDPDGVGGCLKAALAAAGFFPSDEAVKAVMGIPKPVAIGVLIDQDPDSTEVQSIHRDFHARMIEYYRTSPDVQPIEGAEELFRSLRKKGTKVALDTGFDRAIVDVLLARLGWDASVLDATATSDEVANGRPSADLILRLMELTGVTDPSEVAKIGDTPSDLQSGTAAGCKLVVGVTSGATTREVLTSYPHTAILNSVNELAELLH